MNQNEILLRKRNCMFVPQGRSRRAVNSRDPRAMALQAEVMRLGYILSQDLLDQISRLSDARIKELYDSTVRTLRNMVGDDVEHVAFYPNFPRQVMEASSIELFFNAVLHYWTYGQWRPQYEKEARVPEFEHVNFTEIGVAGTEDLMVLAAEILSANASVTDEDREMISNIMSNTAEAAFAEHVPDEIPFKETLCWFVGECHRRGWNTVGVASLNTATDILRAATALSNGDVSLATNTRFVNFRRPLRRAFVQRLNEVGNQDDIMRHRGKWVRLAHSLHVGEYAETAPRAASLIREARDGNSRYRTFDGKVEAAMQNRKRGEVCKLLKQRPGMFARRLDHVIREFGSIPINHFLEVADKVDTRVLLQLLGHFNARTSTVDRRLVFPKGQVAKSRLLTNTLPAIPQSAVNRLRAGIARTLQDRFVDLEGLGKVYIDPSMADCPIPLSLRSASTGVKTVGRGTRMPIGDKGTIRMFIYWKGQDIDLSGFFTNEDFTQEHTISYYNLRSGFACHSGDIVQAPRGASEFIDVNIEQALAQGHRYLCMTVYVFNGPNFSDHEVCYAGWMTRDKVQSNEIYDPKTVEHKIDLTCETRRAIPVIFDLQERQAIWLDLASGGGNICRPNNVATNKASIKDTIEGAMNLDNKPTLADLFYLHASARGRVVDTADEADLVIGWDGDIRPTDTTRILSEFL